MLGNGPGSSWPESGPDHPNPAGCLAQVAFPVLSFHSAPQGSAARCRWGWEGSWGREESGVQTVMVTVLGGQSEPRVPTVGTASSPLGPCRQSSPHGMEVCLLPSRDLTNSRGEDPGRRVECGQAARGHPGVKLSVPQLHGEQGAAGRQVWGRRGPGGSGPGLPPSHLFCSPSGLLLLPPGLPGGWGAETYYPHTPALCVSYRVNSPL